MNKIDDSRPGGSIEPFAEYEWSRALRTAAARGLPGAPRAPQGGQRPHLERYGQSPRSGPQAAAQVAKGRRTLRGSIPLPRPLRGPGPPDSPPDMVGSCLVCFQGVSGCRPGVTHDMIGHRTGSRVPSLRVSAAVRCQLWLFSGRRRHGPAWQLGRVAYKPMLQAGSPMLDTARQPAPISSAAP